MGITGITVITGPFSAEGIMPFAVASLAHAAGDVRQVRRWRPMYGCTLAEYPCEYPRGVPLRSTLAEYPCKYPRGVPSWSTPASTPF